MTGGVGCHVRKDRDALNLVSPVAAACITSAIFARETLVRFGSRECAAKRRQFDEELIGQNRFRARDMKKDVAARCSTERVTQ